jgi:glucuronoarabinoxylan endo-1,4-beta-xylanase
MDWQAAFTCTGYRRTVLLRQRNLYWQNNCYGKQMGFVFSHRKRCEDIRVYVLSIAIVFIFQFLMFLPQLNAQNISDAVIYLDSTQQVIRGFGAANIRPWRPDMTPDEIQKAFGTGPGEIGFSILRLRVPPSTNEFSLSVPTAQAAHSMGVTITASPWSPPPRMKTNNNVVGGRLIETLYADYAAHLKSFVDYLADNNVPLHSISVQNEPDIQVTYESCDWNASEMVTFVKDHGASVGTKLIAPESYNFNPTIANAILNDSSAAANVDIIGGHIYGGGLAPYPLAAEKGKELWMTEHLVLDTSWAAVLGTGKEINDVMLAGMNAYIWWYLVRFYGPISDGEGHIPKGEVTKRGYVMSHFSRFIRPGYERVYTRPILRSTVSVSAYRDDFRLVIVAVNTGSSPREQKFIIPDRPGAGAIITPYVTTKTKNVSRESDIVMLDGSFTVTLEESSITTFVAEEITTSVDDSTPLPETFKLLQNYPNPFNPTTRIGYSIPANSYISLKVFDLLGQEVATLFEGNRDAGSYIEKFDCTRLASGVYLYRLKTEHFSDTKKLVLMK